MTDHTHTPIETTLLPNGTDDMSLMYRVIVCKDCRLILGYPDREEG